MGLVDPVVVRLVLVEQVTEVLVDLVEDLVVLARADLVEVLLVEQVTEVRLVGLDFSVLLVGPDFLVHPLAQEIFCLQVVQVILVLLDTLAILVHLEVPVIWDLLDQGPLALVLDPSAKDHLVVVDLLAVVLPVSQQV